MTRNEALFLSGLMVLLWALMPATQLWDWDEAYYARTGVEMFESGNLILPQFNGELFGHKPPFGFWMMGLASQVFGETEFAARFFSAPALALSAWLTGRTAAILFGQQVGEAAMMVFATSFLSIYLGAAAMLDAYLVAGCALSVWAVVRMVQDQRISLWPWVWFTIGGLVSLLAKGPVGAVLLGGLALGIWVFLPATQRPDWKGFLWLVAGGVIALAGFVFWFIPANASSDGNLAGEAIGVHIIGRALAPMEGHGGQGLIGFLIFLPIYVPVILLGMLPWTAWLPGASRYLFKGMERRNRVILLAWFLPLFVVFSIAATKLPHYIFPIFAPISVAIAAWLAGDEQEKRTFGGLTLSAIFYGVIALGLLWVAIQFTASTSQMLVLLSVIGFAGMASLPWLYPVAIRSIVPIALASLAVMQLFYWGGLREAEKLAKVSKPLGAALQQHAADDALVYSGEYREPSLSFYASRPVDNPIYPVAVADFRELLRVTPRGFIVLTSPELTQFAPLLSDEELKVHATVGARNFNQDGVMQNVYLLEWSRTDG